MISVLKDKDNPIAKLARVVLMVVLMGVLTFGMTMTAFAEENDTENDFSFYKVSSAAASYYDESHNPSHDKFGTFPEGVSVDKAGAFVGFIDENYDSGLIGSTVSFLSGSSQSRSYETFTEEGLQEYVLYGHALSSLGLDSTANETFDILSIARFLGGLALMLCYTTALSADALFAGVIAVLQTFNPFAWFMAGVNAVSNAFASWFDTTPEVPALFDGLSQFITQWYQAASDLGMYLVFLLFFLSLGVCLLLWKSQANRVGSVFRTFATRLAFICIGIPLLGGLYTASLDLAAESSWGDEFTPAANQVIAATLVDFEGWATNSNLALPSGVTITVDTTDSASGVVDAGKSTSVRGIARAINRSNSALSYTSGWDSSWNMSLKGGSQSQSAVLGAYDVMGRYMSSAFYHASDYETTYKADISDDENAEKIYEGIKDTSGKKDEYYDHVGNMLDNASDSTGQTTTPYFNDGNKENIGAEMNGNIITFHRGGSSDGTDAGGTGGYYSGLSSMSMYNYLTTSFGDSSVVTYSTHKATSGLVVQAHHSVNLIGDGMTAVLYWLNACIILFVITIIGLVYSIGLIINMLGRGIKMVSSVPFAVLGNMKAMAKVTTYTAMMIIEVLGTFFVYSLVIEILLSLSGLVETPMLELLSDSVGSTVLMNGTIVPGANAAIPAMASNALITVGVLLSCIIYLWFGIKAIKLRKSIIKTIDEAVAGLIDRIFTTNPQGGSMSNAQNAGKGIATAPTLGEKAKNAGKQIAGGVAGGAGMALGQAAVGGALGKLSDGMTAGSVLKGAAAGGAENAGGMAEEMATGTGIEGADRQGLPGGGDGQNDSLRNVPSGPVSGEEAGRRMLAENADSLGNLKAGDEADVPDVSAMNAGQSQNGQDVTDIKGIQASAEASDAEVHGMAAQAEQMQETKDVKPGDKRQLAADAKVDSMVGNTSALEEDADAKAKREVKADAAKDAVKGVAKTAKGVAEGAAAYATGDVQMAGDAVKDVAGGVKQTADAANKGAHADQNVDAVRAQRNQARKEATGSRSGAPAAGQAQGAQQGGNVQKGATAQQSQPSHSGTSQRPGMTMPAGGGNVMSVKGGTTSNISNAGPTNVSVQPQAQMSPQDRQRMMHLQSEQKALERAREQVKRTGTATLPGGRIVHNTADVNTALRQNHTAQEKLKSGGAKKAADVAKKALDVKKGAGGGSVV